MFKREVNTRLIKRAINCMPGGVNSPINAFQHVGIKPIYFKSGKGSKFVSLSGKSYIDFVCSWGAEIMGHTNQIVLKALVNQLKRGIGYGSTTQNEIDLAELVKKMVTGINKIRLVNSGTEAGMTAICLARAYTGKNKIIKFEGCYHGQIESLLSDSENANDQKNQLLNGIPASFSNETLIAKYNNIKSVNALFHKFPKDIAALIIEPVATNMGCVLPEEGFLEGLRYLCNEHKTVLIFDEISTGFRLARGGAQEFFNVHADLVIYGKILGGGLPVGAIAGKEEIMDLLAPEGTINQSTTFSGNPLIMAMGCSILKYLYTNTYIYKNLEEKTTQLVSEMNEIFSLMKIPVTINHIGSMFSVFFTEKKVIDYNTTKTGDNNNFKSFYKHLIKNGIFFPPSPFETCYISVAHSDRDIRRTIRVIKKWKKKV